MELKDLPNHSKNASDAYENFSNYKEKTKLFHDTNTSRKYFGVEIQCLNTTNIFKVDERHLKPFYKGFQVENTKEIEFQVPI